MNIRTLILACVAVISPAAISQADSAPVVNAFSHIVVIYQENHSFDNLYGTWGGVNGHRVNGLDSADPADEIQVRADDKETPDTCLLQNDVNLASPPLSTTCTVTDSTGKEVNSHFPNKPFMIDEYFNPADTTCPNPVKGKLPDEAVKMGSDVAVAGGCTRDLVHGFYDEQYQINKGKQNRYVTGSNAAGLVMGYYDTTKLPIYSYLHIPGAPNYVIAESFFHAAFEGSFLNHQWLIAAATPEFTDAIDNRSENDLHTVVDANGMPTDTRPPIYLSPPARLGRIAPSPR